MRKIRAMLLVSLFALLITSGAFAEAPLPLTLKPDLTCTLCGIEKAPVVVETQKPVPLIFKEVRPAQPVREDWYFISYYYKVGTTRGPFSSRLDCEEARRLVSRSDLCFLDERRIWID
ncbi:MAG: hypothetical protein Q7K40_04380 [bacterium]|nr:hypothetical protein [bacterium]